MTTAAEPNAGTEADDVPIDLDAPTEHQVAGGGRRAVSLALVFGGAIGLIASFALMLERIALLRDPEHVPSCDFGNPLISCASVMETPQAEAFGFPNPLLGIASFAAVVAIGAVLLAGARLPRWFWLGLQAGTLFGIGLVTWLQYQSVYGIGALCPYCMVVWAAMIPIFVYVTAHDVQAGHIPASPRVRTAVVRNRAIIVMVWYAAVVAFVLTRFWADFFG